jgi:hypothetical protein
MLEVVKFLSLSRDVRVSFFCVAKRKKPKKTLPRCRLFPSVLAPHLGGCGTRAYSPQTVLAAYHLPLKPKARQGEFESQNHLSTVILSETKNPVVSIDI